MDDHIRSLVHLVLAAPCFILVMRLYKMQRKEPDARERLLQRLGIVWAATIFLVLGFSFEWFWTTYIWGG